jgi:hypothetical protein
MTVKKLTVTLAGKSYHATVPLTLGQLEDLNVAMVLPGDPDPQKEVRKNAERNREIMLAALLPENPELSHDVLRGMRATNQEYIQAISDIIDASGLVAKRDAAAGEAPAETIAA